MSVRTAVHEALAAALNGLPDHTGVAGDPVMTCSHFVAEPVLIMCTHHPAAGVMCPDCAGEHVRRCGSLPLVCSVCSAAPSVEVPPVPLTPPLAVPVQTTAGVDALWSGRLGFIGTAACRACAAAAGDAR